MIQKKVCMVGMFGTGKTSLVRQFVYSIFNERYHSTIGVKIDRKVVRVDDVEITLVLWDLAGRETVSEVSPIFLRGALRGAHGVIYVADGTLKPTCDKIRDLQTLANQLVGDVPSIVALNKSDLTAEWAIGERDRGAISSSAPIHDTSAKTGGGVEHVFQSLAVAMTSNGKRRV